MRNRKSTARKSILIVDDEHDMRLVLRAIFDRAGYSVTEARDGQEALDLLQGERFDLMVLDLTMPQVSGRQVLQQLGEKRLKEMPVIILSAKSPHRHAGIEYRENTLFYVVKPFPNALIRDLAKCLLENLKEEEKNRTLFGLLRYPCFAINFDLLGVDKPD